MINDKEELERFKDEIDLFRIVEEYGFTADNEKGGSSRTFHNGAGKTGDKITVSIVKAGVKDIYVYKNWHDDQDRGTVIDFLKNRESGLNFGKIRAKLRTYLTGGSPQTKAKNIEILRPSTTNSRPKFTNVAEDDIDEPQKRLSLDQIKEAWRQLAQYQSPYLIGRGLKPEIIKGFDVRVDAENNACFAHWDDGVVTGWEVKNKLFTGYSKGCSKSLMTARLDTIPISRVILVEAAIDAASYAQMKYQPGDLYVSTSGTISGAQLECLIKLLETYSTARIVCAHDADIAGDKFAQGIQIIAQPGTEVVRDRPPVSDHPTAPGKKSKDWNDELMRLLEKPVKTFQVLKSNTVYPRRRDKQQGVKP